MSLSQLKTIRILMDIFVMLMVVLFLLGCYGLLTNKSAESIVKSPNLPALFLYLSLGNNANEMTSRKTIEGRDYYGNHSVAVEQREPLIYAALNTPLSTYKIILLHWFGADLNAATEGGDTTLSMAISWQDRFSVCYLVNHGAQTTTLSTEDKQALAEFACNS